MGGCIVTIERFFNFSKYLTTENILFLKGKAIEH